jgi:hypothetical protein
MGEGATHEFSQISAHHRSHKKKKSISSRIIFVKIRVDEGKEKTLRKYFLVKSPKSLNTNNRMNHILENPKGVQSKSTVCNSKARRA